MMDFETATHDDIISGVEKMIQAEQKQNESMKKDKKKATKELDLNEGVAPAQTSTPAKKAAAVAGSASGSVDTVRTSESTVSFEEKELEESLDSDLSKLKRKATMVVKSDNVGAAFMSNIEAISESVNEFKKKEEESGTNDVML